MQYIKEGATLPVPFNIVPTPKAFMNLIKTIANLFKKKEPKKKIEDLPPAPARPGGKRNPNLDSSMNNSVMVFEIKLFI